MEECELSNRQLDELANVKVFINEYTWYIPAHDIKDAWKLIKLTIGQGTQRGTINCKGRYYFWRCCSKAVVGEAVEKTMERAMTVAVLRSMKIIPGGIDHNIKQQLERPVIGTDLEDN